MLDISLLIFLSVFPFSTGYAVGEAKSFNFWKLLAAGLIIYPFLYQFTGNASHIVAVSFAIGFLLPHFHVFAGIRNSLSDFYNSIRYHSIYAEIKRKAEDIEKAKTEYEQATQEARKAKRDYEEATRRAGQERETWQRKNQGSQQGSSQEQAKQSNSNNQRKKSSDQKSNSSNQQKKSQSSANSPLKEKYLKTLGLEDGNYSKKDIKTAYRRAAMKWHPDREGGDVERFREVQTAYEWLLVKAA